MAFLGTWLACAIAAAFATWIVPGMTTLGGVEGLALFALVMALVNASVRPVMRVLSLPLTIVTLGLFHFVVNALSVMLCSWLSFNLFGVGVYVEGFGAALVGSIVISIVGSIAESILGVDDD